MKRSAPLILVLVLAAAGACIKKVEKVSIPELKRNALTASREQLVELINKRYGGIRSVRFSRLGVQAEGYYPAQEKKESYPKGGGYLVVQRPHWILMNINNPLTHSTVAALASNGRTFQIWVPRENKYITGSLDVKVEGENPFYNIRPQHVFEAIFVQPLENGKGRSFYVFEDSDPQYSYYVIADFLTSGLEPHLLRHLWIERSALHVVRQQWYGAKGELLGDVNYGKETQVNGFPVFLDVKLSRPVDAYRLSFAFEPDAIKVNEPVEESAFNVIRPPGSELVEVKGKSEP
ncbi:MAG TPA: hypothetical protein VIF64_16225 [Pyrinomonadaceae bacterium]